MILDHTRRRQIILLQRTLTDFDYQPKTATGAAIARNTKAEAHEGNEKTILCRDCGGDGEKRIRTVIQLCTTCKGRGVEVVDEYTGRRLQTEHQAGEAKPPRMVRCDSCGGSGKGKWWRNGDELTNTCRRCWGAKLLPGPSHPIRPWRAQPLRLTADAPELGRGDPVIACMERRQIAGSYEELGLALGVLRLEQRQLYRLDVRVFVEAECEEDELRLDQALQLEQALGIIDRLMPEEIRVPSWAERFEQRRRDKVSETRGEEAA